MVNPPRHPPSGVPLSLPIEAIAALCRRYGVHRLALFGSALRGELRPDSDIDLLVEFEHGKTPGLRFFTLQDELSELIGRPVDLNTVGFLSPDFAAEVAEHARTIYGAA
jgi:predicted nucleotidyltransferase